MIRNILRRFRKQRVVPGLLVMGDPVQISRGVAVVPRFVLEKYGDEIRRIVGPDTDVVAAEDLE